MGPVSKARSALSCGEGEGERGGQGTIESSVKSTILRSPATVADRAEEARMSAKCERL